MLPLRPPDSSPELELSPDSDSSLDSESLLLSLLELLEEGGEGSRLVLRLELPPPFLLAFSVMGLFLPFPFFAFESWGGVTCVSVAAGGAGCCESPVPHAHCGLPAPHAFCRAMARLAMGEVMPGVLPTGAPCRPPWEPPMSAVTSCTAAAIVAGSLACEAGVRVDVAAGAHEAQPAGWLPLALGERLPLQGVARPLCSALLEP